MEDQDKNAGQGFVNMGASPVNMGNSPATGATADQPPDAGELERLRAENQQLRERLDQSAAASTDREKVPAGTSEDEPAPTDPADFDYRRYS